MTEFKHTVRIPVCLISGTVFSYMKTSNDSDLGQFQSRLSWLMGGRSEEDTAWNAYGRSFPNDAETTVEGRSKSYFPQSQLWFGDEGMELPSVGAGELSPEIVMEFKVADSGLEDATVAAAEETITLVPGESPITPKDYMDEIKAQYVPRFPLDPKISTEVHVNATVPANSSNGLAEDLPVDIPVLEVYARALDELVKAQVEIQKSVEMGEEVSWEIRLTKDVGMGPLEHIVSGKLPFSSGITSMGFEIEVPITVKDGVAQVDKTIETNDDAVVAAARSAARSYEHDLLVGLQAYADTGVQDAIPDSVRPAATEDDALSDSDKQFFDAWWANMVQVREQGINDAAKVDPATQESFEDALQEDPELTEESWWPGAVADAESALPDGDASGGSWLTTIGSGLKWAGDSTLDLLKSWGPMGTVGAYAGVKATNDVSSMNSIMPWLLIGGVALLVMT